LTKLSPSSGDLTQDKARAKDHAIVRPRSPCGAFANNNQETSTSEPVFVSAGQGQSSEFEASKSSDGNAEAGPPTSESPSSSIPPWTEWEVDENSLCCINQWNREHQNNKFSTVVLERVNRILESKVFDATLAFIPDNPVPAKSLVKALVSLTLLVTKIPETKQEVCDFAMEVATDISLLADAFGTSDSPLLSRAWEDLKETRDCVNDICMWARNQLLKYFSDASGLHLKIGDWRVKLDGAKSKFSQRALIHILKAVDAVNRDLQNMTPCLDDINRSLRNMTPCLEKLHEDHLIKGLLRFIQTTLGKRVVPLAKYDAKGQKKERIS